MKLFCLRFSDEEEFQQKLIDIRHQYDSAALEQLVRHEADMEQLQEQIRELESANERLRCSKDARPDERLVEALVGREIDKADARAAKAQEENELMERQLETVKAELTSANASERRRMAEMEERIKVLFDEVQSLRCFTELLKARLSSSSDAQRARMEVMVQRVRFD